jgi:hypothetical protein
MDNDEVREESKVESKFDEWTHASASQRTCAVLKMLDSLAL